MAQTAKAASARPTTMNSITRELLGVIQSDAAFELQNRQVTDEQLQAILEAARWARPERTHNLGN
jgi:hypothetical protein